MLWGLISVCVCLNVFGGIRRWAYCLSVSKRVTVVTYIICLCLRGLYLYHNQYKKKRIHASVTRYPFLSSSIPTWERKFLFLAAHLLMQIKGITKRWSVTAVAIEEEFVVKNMLTCNTSVVKTVPNRCQISLGSSYSNPL